MSEITLASSVMLFIVVQSANMGICGGSGSGEKWYPLSQAEGHSLTAVWSWQMVRDPGATGVHANSPSPCSF